jgi:hypothetical protein
MAAAFERRRKQLHERMRITASVEAIPDYKVRTPLQQAIMILKRHRDVRFAERPDDRPISVILTTLAGHAYSGEETIAQALLAILTRMDHFIQNRNGIYWIPNPTDPMENFADKWAKHPERERAFREWLELARADFLGLARLLNRQAITESIAPRIGRPLAERARNRRMVGSQNLLRAASVAPVASGGAFSFPNAPRVPTKPQGFA